MRRCHLTNYQVLGLVLFAFGWGGMIALVAFIPTQWAILWGGLSMIGGAFLAFGRPMDCDLNPLMNKVIDSRLPDQFCITRPDGSCVGGRMAGKPPCLHDPRPLFPDPPWSHLPRCEPNEDGEYKATL